MSIGLCGPAGCGKNAVGALLEKYFNRRQASFAEALRCEVAEVTTGKKWIPLDILLTPHLWRLAFNLAICKIKRIDPWAKPTPKPMRTALQLWGTEYRRSGNQNYWVDRVPKDWNIVYTDVRFQNEKAICKQLWYVWRPSAENNRGVHVSENGISMQDCDVVIDNSGSIEDLENQFMRVYDLVRQRRAARSRNK